MAVMTAGRAAAGKAKTDVLGRSSVASGLIIDFPGFDWNSPDGPPCRDRFDATGDGWTVQPLAGLVATKPTGARRPAPMSTQKAVRSARGHVVDQYGADVYTMNGTPVKSAEEKKAKYPA